MHRVADAVSAYGKDGVFIPFLLDDHPDHRVASDLLYQAFTEGKIPANVAVWAYQVYSMVIPNVVVDITEFAQEKKHLIEAYQSQYRRRNWGHFALGTNAHNSRFLEDSRGERYAEVFFQLPLKDYAEQCKIFFSGCTGRTDDPRQGAE